MLSAKPENRTLWSSLLMLFPQVLVLWVWTSLYTDLSMFMDYRNMQKHFFSKTLGKSGRLLVKAVSFL